MSLGQLAGATQPGIQSQFDPPHPPCAPRPQRPRPPTRRRVSASADYRTDSCKRAASYRGHEGQSGSSPDRGWRKERRQDGTVSAGNFSARSGARIAVVRDGPACPDRWGARRGHSCAEARP